MVSRNDIRNAYSNICPTRTQKERMLEKILSAASDSAPAEKDKIMMRRKMKPVVVAALVGLMILLMGCAIVAMNLDDLKIGKTQYTEGNYIGVNGESIPSTEIISDVISIQGIRNSPNQLAAKEWFEFKEDYDVDGALALEADRTGFEAPSDYDAYRVYTQDMIDIVDEIAKKYGLKLAGCVAVAQEYETDIFFESLGLENLHREAAAPDVEYLSGYFYACGNFKLGFLLSLTGESDYDSLEILGSMHYSDKEYLDTLVFSVEAEKCEQWNYRTDDGAEILIIRKDDWARLLYDREDAFISVYLYTDYVNENGEASYLSHADVERVADTMDFTVKPQKPDMEATLEKLRESQARREAEQAALEATRSNDTYAGFIRDRLEALDNPETLLYYLMDVNGDSVNDLLLGYADSCETVWTIQDGILNLASLTDEVWVKIDDIWKELDIKPITEFPLDE